MNCTVNLTVSAHTTRHPPRTHHSPPTTRHTPHATLPMPHTTHPPPIHHTYHMPHDTCLPIGLHSPLDIAIGLAVGLWQLAAWCVRACSARSYVVGRLGFACWLHLPSKRSHTMCHVPCAMCHVPCAMCHVPCAMCHVPCAMCHVPCAMCHVPCACNVPCDMCMPCVCSLPEHPMQIWPSDCDASVHLPSFLGLGPPSPHTPPPPTPTPHPPPTLCVQCSRSNAL
jgi:hypothetical protein